MSTQTDVRSASQHTGTERMVHICCCYPWRALCGSRVHGPTVEDPAECVVCIDLAEDEYRQCSRLCKAKDWVWWHVKGRWRE